MRFISPHSRYKYIAIHEVTEILADGTRRPIKPGYICFFQPGDLTDWEKEEARRTFTMRGGTMEADGVTPVDVYLRVGSFDSSVVPEAIREEVEQSLLRSQQPADHIHVPKPQIPKPWPRYDEIHIGNTYRDEEAVSKAICVRVQDLGLDPDDVAFYERATEDRPYVLGALNTLVPKGEDAPIVVSA